MPVVSIRVLTPEERAAELVAQEGEVARALRGVYLRGIGLSFLSCAIGLVFVAFSLRTSDVESGLILFWLGLLIGNGGILATLVFTHQRAVEEEWL
jgi:hypothetical protein